MTRTEAENSKRLQLVTQHGREAVTFAARRFGPLPPDREEEFVIRMAEAMRVLVESEENDALDLLARSAVLLLAAELSGHLVPDVVARRSELLCIGTAAGRTLLASGRYPAPSETQHAKIAKLVSERAEQLVALGESITRAVAREEIRKAGRAAVAITVGRESPRSHLH
ncbi:hypothetical protein [Myxococcus sp. Y35]|uniref:hypothetical protein n=1 Tax=Pseudomyxococcus flavus TaxID=3115648 RepID=UPI003CF7AD56